MGYRAWKEAGNAVAEAFKALRNGTYVFSRRPVEYATADFVGAPRQASMLLVERELRKPRDMPFHLAQVTVELATLFIDQDPKVTWDQEALDGLSLDAEALLELIDQSANEQGDPTVRVSQLYPVTAAEFAVKAASGMVAGIELDLHLEY